MQCRRMRGFSLVELMIAVAILGVLLAIALPNMSAYVENTRIRSAAEAFVTAVDVAKATAASTNSQTEILLTDTSDAASLATATGSLAASGWMVRTADLSRFIEGKSLLEGSGGNAAIVQLTGTVSGVVFTPLGGTTLASTATFAFTNPVRGGACVSDSPAGPMRCLNVMVTPTGRVKLCDPAVAAPDNRACS